MNSAVPGDSAAGCVGSIGGSLIPELLDAVRKSGYRASLGGADDDEPSLRAERLGLLWTALLAAPILFIHQGIARFSGAPFVLLALATLLQFTSGLRFYRGAWYSLRSRNAGMDVLVAVGITAAWGFSALVVLFPGTFGEAHTFFDTTALLVLFIRLGKMLEARAKGKASDALRALLRAAPEKALRVAGGVEEEVPVSTLVPGDLFRVRPGDRVPVDGEIVDGEAAIDEAAVTGESIPVRRVPGDAVTGGTLLRDGSVLVRAVAVGEATFLGRMVRLVEEAQLDRAPIQRFADRVSNRFVPAVLVLAAAVWIVWYLVIRMPFPFALARAVSVVVIACPCALGLATPTAILVGSGVALRRGILFKRASVLEKVAGLRTVLFDKTGTITKGEPALTDVRTAAGLGEDRALASAAAGAAKSGHPLSKAIVRAAREKGAPWGDSTDIEERPGLGIRFAEQGAVRLLGSETMLDETNIDTSYFRADADRWADEGKTVLWLAEGGRALAVFGLRDEAKPGVIDVIARIRSLGIRTALVTGDRRRTAEGIAASIGIGEVFAEVLPERKAEIVRAAKERGGTVAMVGD
ncbi:MAG: heavy metal translocating P-type ATPase, partial [Candidatus Latescibacterota bacterium]